MELSAQMPVNKVDNVELMLDNIRLQYKFGDIENLRGKRIRIIEAFRNTETPTSPMGNTLVADEIFNKAYLVLCINGKEEINRVPLRVFNPTNNSGRRVLLNDLSIDWPKSYVELGSIANVNVGTAFFFNVYYEDKK
jgi:hypothetical protein